MGIKQRAINSQLGVEITSIVTTKKNTAVTKKEVMVFDMNNLQQYKEDFSKLVDENIISGVYESDSWSGIGDKYVRRFEFKEFEYNKPIYEALKAFCVTQLYHNRTSIDTVKNYFSQVKKVIKITKNFDVNYITRLDDILDEYNESTVKELLAGVVHYLLLNPVNDAKEYLETLSFREEWNSSASTPRTLPPATSIIAFSNVIEDYFKKATENQKVRFYPIYIWWRITSIIPMRPTEFLRIKRDCLDAKDGYSMQITRKKKKPNPLSKKAQVPFCDTFNITKEINDLICDYIDKAGISDETFLFPLTVYSRYSKWEKSVLNISTHKDRFNYNHLKNLLSQFYTEVVSEQYDIVNSVDELTEDNQQSIVKLKLGDTRHLAFCSLMLQGFNPLTIASLGGHRSLDSQMNYHRHLDSYIDCQVYLLKQLIKRDVTAIGFDSNAKTSRELALVSYNDMEAVRDIEEGLCCSTDFPNECTSVRCVRCSKFKLDMSRITDNLRAELTTAYNDIDEEVKSKLAFIQRYYSTGIEELSSNVNDNELKKDAVMLRKAIEEKARIIAMQEKIKEV